MDAIERLRRFLDNDPNIIFAVVFGSTAKKKDAGSSDIDVGIFFTDPPVGLDLLDFMYDLSDLACTDVDVVVLNGSSALLRHQAMKYRMVLTIKNDDIYRKFREKTISDYEEYKFISGMTVYDR